MRDLDHPVLAGVENTRSWCVRLGIYSMLFAYMFRWFPSSVITVTADSERLTCGGFSLGETVHLGCFEFIADYFCGLSLSPRRGDLDAAFMGSTRSGTPSPRHVMIEDSIEEFLTTSSSEGGFNLPSPKSHGTAAPSAPVTTTP
jgi:hypothetical protein